MQMMKNEKGITLMVMVITIIIMTMLAGVTFNMGYDSVNDTKDRNLKSELQIVGQAIVTEYAKAIDLGYIVEGEEPTNTVPDNFVGNRIVPGTDTRPALTNGSWKLSLSEAIGYKSYFTLTPENIERLGLQNTDYTYIVNYYTGEVYNKSKKQTSKGDDLYIRINNSNETIKTTDTTSFVE